MLGVSTPFFGASMPFLGAVAVAVAVELGAGGGVACRDGDGRGTLVEFVIDARLREVRYVLRYAFDEPHAIRWDYVEGDVRSVDGDFTFETVDGGLLTQIGGVPKTE